VHQHKSRKRQLTTLTDIPHIAAT